jgi:hypothetical protein
VVLLYTLNPLHHYEQVAITSYIAMLFLWKFPYAVEMALDEVVGAVKLLLLVSRIFATHYDWMGRSNNTTVAHGDSVVIMKHSFDVCINMNLEILLFSVVHFFKFSSCLYDRVALDVSVQGSSRN